VTSRDDANDLVLARMRVYEALEGDEDAAASLLKLPFDAVIAACFEVMDAPDEPGSTDPTETPPKAG
jgi:hypothetical protein